MKGIFKMVNTTRKSGAGGHVGKTQGGPARPSPQPKPQPQPQQQNPNK
jgi:hypothetical protein